MSLRIVRPLRIVETDAVGLANFAMRVMDSAGWGNIQSAPTIVHKESQTVEIRGVMTTSREMGKEWPMNQKGKIKR